MIHVLLTILVAYAFSKVSGPRLKRPPRVIDLSFLVFLSSNQNQDYCSYSTLDFLRKGAEKKGIDVPDVSPTTSDAQRWDD